MSRDFNGRSKSPSGKPIVMTSDVAWVLHKAGFYSPVIADSARLSSVKFCSLLISSGIADKMTSGVAWVLHRAGFYSPASFWQLYKFSDVSDLQSPIDGGSAVMR